MGNIRAEGVTKKFKLKSDQLVDNNGILSNEVEVLSGADLQVREGEFLVLVGPSGCGKSVLLDIIGGLTKASGGRVFHNDIPVDGPNLKTGYVFQQYALFPWRNALSNIEFGLETRGVSKEVREKKARELLCVFGLSGFGDRFPYRLSGGMQQRVAIARALVTEPLIVLADEPTANLDSETGMRIVELMRRINEEEQTTFVFSTHDAHIMGEARRVVRILDGRIVEEE